MAIPGAPNWQAQILHATGSPVTPANITFLNAWARAEGGAATNNPFNTTQPSPHAVGDYNRVGVKNYATPEAGIAATAQTLLNGRYGNIIGSLRKGQSAVESAQALANSPWGTGSLVLKVLGANPSEVSPPPSLSAPAPVRQTAPTGPNIDALLAIAEGASPLDVLNKIGAAPSAPPPRQQTAAPTPTPPQATAAGLKLAFVPGRFTTRSGLEVNKQILPNVLQLARQFGVKANSGYRSPAHNAAVGGAPESDHLKGNAVDFVGTPAQMRALYQYVQGRYPYVESWSQSQNHVHVSFIR